MPATSAKLVQRFAAAPVATALSDTPVVMIIGPRQCGKTTLVRDMVAGTRTYVTLDNDAVFKDLRADPNAFVRSVEQATVDEVQRAPDLLRAIKIAVDQDRRPGRFLLTGSANVLTLPTVSESLAGRMEIVTLLPLSRAEIRGRPPTFLEKAFGGTLPKSPQTVIGRELVDAVLTGGYPEMLRRNTQARRNTWARSYVRTLLERDVRDIWDIERRDLLPRLLRMLAHFSGRLVNFAQIGAQLGLDDKTTKKYVAILEDLFLVRRLEPWARNRLTRLVKTPKLHFLDSGLLATMLNGTTERVGRDRAVLGPLLETFVFSEILKQTTWIDEPFTLLHYRDKDQDEVDLIVERGSGDLIGVEVKAGATVTSGDFKGLRKLANAAARDFMLGVVLYDGDLTVPFGERMFAAPLSCVWA